MKKQGRPKKQYTKQEMRSFGRMARLYNEEEWSYSDIAEDYDICPEYVRTVLLRLGLVKSRNNLVTTDKDNKKIISMYNSGISALKISKEFEIGKDTVLNILSRNNIKLRHPGEYGKINFTKTQISLVIQRYNVEGYSAQELACHFKVDTGVIFRVLKENNIDIKNFSQTIFDKRLRRLKESDFMTKGITLQDYSHQLRMLTEYVYYRYKSKISSYKRSRKYHLDHKYSINDGYYNPKNLKINALPSEICHPVNLRVVSLNSNLRKHKGSLFSLFELRERIKVFNNKFGNPYKKHPYLRKRIQEITEIILGGE